MFGEDNDPKNVSVETNATRNFMQGHSDEESDFSVFNYTIMAKPPCSRWSPDEDYKLKEAVKMFEETNYNWQMIADIMGGSKTGVQCRQRWTKVLRPGIVKGRWYSHEDRILTDIVQIQLSQNARVNWTKVAEAIPTRTSKQCRERWTHHLSPDLRREQFTAEEDERLISLLKKYGTKWAKIAKEMNGRTENTVRSRIELLKSQAIRRKGDEKKSATSVKSIYSKNRNMTSKQDERSKAKSTSSDQHNNHSLISIDSNLSQEIDISAPSNAEFHNNKSSASIRSLESNDDVKCKRLKIDNENCVRLENSNLPSYQDAYQLGIFLPSLEDYGFSSLFRNQFIDMFPTMNASDPNFSADSSAANQSSSSSAYSYYYDMSLLMSMNSQEDCWLQSILKINRELWEDFKEVYCPELNL